MKFSVFQEYVKSNHQPKPTSDCQSIYFSTSNIRTKEISQSNLFLIFWIFFNLKTSHRPIPGISTGIFRLIFAHSRKIWNWSGQWKLFFIKEPVNYSRGSNVYVLIHIWSTTPNTWLKLFSYSRFSLEKFSHAQNSE